MIMAILTVVFVLDGSSQLKVYALRARKLLKAFWRPCISGKEAAYRQDRPPMYCVRGHRKTTMSFTCLLSNSDNCQIHPHQCPYKHPSLNNNKCPSCPADTRYSPKQSNYSTLFLFVTFPFKPTTPSTPELGLGAAVRGTGIVLLEVSALVATTLD